MKIDWKKELLNKSAFCYIKPTENIHDSGYGCFEVGYIIINRHNKKKHKLILGEYSDHIWNHESKGVYISMDLLLDGYIRIFNNGHILWWGSLNFTTSSATLEILN